MRQQNETQTEAQNAVGQGTLHSSVTTCIFALLLYSPLHQLSATSETEHKAGAVQLFLHSKPSKKLENKPFSG